MVRNVSIQEHTTADSYIPQDEDDFNKWDCVKIDPFKTDDVKT